MLRCSIVTPTESIFDGEIKYASLPAWDGQLGVMPGQSPVLTRLGIGPLRLELPDGTSGWYLVDGGFAQVQENTLSILTDLAASADSISREEAQAELAEANARVTTGGEDQARVRADQQRARGKLALLDEALMTTAARETAAPHDPAPSEEPCADLALETRVEALLLASDRPLGEARLAALLGIPTKGAGKVVEDAVQRLNESYDQTGRSFTAQRVAGGWQLMTRPELAPLMARLVTDRQQSRLSQAALETLAIVAHRQPVMRAEIEAIRGVSSGEVLRALLERRLIKIAGRAEELGRPMLYGTTQEFLKVFGLATLDDLPQMERSES